MHSNPPTQGKEARVPLELIEVVAFPLVVLGRNKGREANLATEDPSYCLPQEIWIPLSDSAHRLGLSCWMFRRTNRSIEQFRLLATFVPARDGKFDGSVQDEVAYLASIHLVPSRAVA